MYLFTVNCIEKTKIKISEAGKGPFLKNVIFNSNESVLTKITIFANALDAVVVILIKAFVILLPNAADVAVVIVVVVYTHSLTLQLQFNSRSK